MEVKRNITLVCLVLLTLVAFPKEIPESLSVNDAIAIARANNTGLRGGLKSDDNELIKEVYAKYFNVQLQNECVNTISEVRNYVINELTKKNIKNSEKTDYHLNAHSIVTDLNVILLTHKIERENSMLELYDVLGVSNSQNFSLVTALDKHVKKYELTVDKADNDAKVTEIGAKDLYNMKMSLLQNLDIMNELSKQKLKKVLAKSQPKYTEISNAIENHINRQISYLLQLLDLKLMRSVVR